MIPVVHKKGSINTRLEVRNTTQNVRCLSSNTYNQIRLGTFTLTGVNPSAIRPSNERRVVVKIVFDMAIAAFIITQSGLASNRNEPAVAVRLNKCRVSLFVTALLL
jgi:hypothetical protein